MTDIEYIEQRLRNQQEYHNKNSTTLKARYILLSTLVLVLSAMIPVITYLTDIFPLTAKIIISAIGGASAVITGYLSISKTQELFIEYRMISERLKGLEFLYQTKTPPFDKEDAFSLLVVACENIINNGNDNWHKTLAADIAKLENKTN